MFDIFCKVIDNYGDAGVCLRLCRDLTKNNFEVNLFIDNIDTLKKLLSNEDIYNENLRIYSLNKIIENYQPSNVVIQAFSQRLEYSLLKKIKKNNSLVINLDYLTAESFAESCHCLPSYTDEIESYFFFPGFTKKTGGLIIENDFREKLKNFVENKTTDIVSVSLFSYQNINVNFFVNFLYNSKKFFKVKVFEGKPADTINSIFNIKLEKIKSLTIRNIEFYYSEFVNQTEYDNILINSDINLVRGEDSIVRAMLSGKPFLWNIYPQEDNYHINKINALFKVISEKCSNKSAVEKIRYLTLKYNSLDADSDITEIKIDDFFDEWKILAKEWSKYLLSMNSLTNNLLQFTIEHMKICKQSR